MSNFYNLFSTYFLHIFWIMAAFLCLYNIYFDLFKIKKRHQYMSDKDLMNKYFLASRKGLLK